MAKKFTFDDAITTDIKGAASNSYIDNIKMIKIADIETNAENFYSLPDIEDLAEDIDRQGLIHSLAVAKISSEKYKLISGHRRLTAIKLLVEKNYRIQQLSEQVIQLQEERQSLERTINEKNNEINKLKEQIEKYRYSRDDKQTLYR